MDNGVLEVANMTKEADSRRSRRRGGSDFQKLYDVYADWRSKGYVIKTGFKFGTHFRIYFPGRTAGQGHEVGALDARDTGLPEGREAAHIRMVAGR